MIEMEFRSNISNSSGSCGDANRGEGVCRCPSNYKPHNLTDEEAKVFRRRYRHYLTTYHDSRHRGKIHLHHDMLSKIHKYKEQDRKMVKENMMRIWRLMTWPTPTEVLLEVDVDIAVENYITHLHNVDNAVREEGRAAIRSIANGFFTLLDKDKDGVIALKTWMSHYSVMSGMELETCQRTFSHIDVSGIGFLCKNDVVDAVLGFFCRPSPNYYNYVFGPIADSNRP
ncbi:hypothetical protein EB796_004487 [Bugula neritina]|uniref:Uncharacterized protein n=1 Tax=Bugula neritina TaxID=10212 RepID=A0A7J7KHT8_BUGNE|nr:hypothetical protein EB796_004487 [Bugula neritina]